jgi:hypothetical protein
MVETTGRVAVGTALLIAVVAAVDAVRGSHWDQVVMLAAIAVLLVVVVVADRVRPPCVAVRADLIEWLRDESTRTDDSIARIASRALAEHRAARGGAAQEP